MKARVLLLIVAGVVALGAPGLLNRTWCPAQAAFHQVVPSIDMARVKNECRQFETAMDSAIQKAIPHPMFLTEKTQGAYLENYGLIFQLTVNLGRGFILFPGTQAPERDPKAVNVENRRTLAQLKTSILTVLWQSGNGISQLSSGAKISIIATVLNLPLGRDESLKRVMVLTVQKADLPDGRPGARLGYEEFKRRVKCIDY